MSAFALDYPRTKNKQISSRYARRCFEDLRAGGLNVEESLAALRADGFSVSDLAGFSGKPDETPTGALPLSKASAMRPPRPASAIEPPTSNLELLKRIWNYADARPWRTLAGIFAAAVSLAALTAYKLAALTFRRLAR
jgi:hypothetical protein